ncbi:NUDIX domain-containing protein [Kitasatospora sp. NPDC057692]|uniref:NUDIX domain-containing protein n=1 Tax=Kitasatospora sp. NPDC057692 TaxID=3346215 RepID=UPI0036B9B6F0
MSSAPDSAAEGVRIVVVAGSGRELLAAAGVLFPDARGRVLLVRLPYDRKRPVAVPGGGCDPQDGSPRRTAVREIEEELGFTPRLGALACLDWTLDHHRPPIAAHLYWAEPLTPEQAAAFTPDRAEVGGWAWLTPDQAGRALPPRLSRRVTACLRAPRAAAPLELEDGQPVGHSLDHLSSVPAPAYTGEAGLSELSEHWPREADPAPPADAPPLLDRAAYIASLPRIRAKARTVFTDRAGRVLLVRQRPWDLPGGEVPYWTLPGGGIEADRELPRAAARREVREELGWSCEPGRLLALDWLPGRAADPAADRETAVLVYLFDGGTVADERFASIVLAEEELVEWRLCDPVEARALLTPASWARTSAALATRDRPGGPAELVGGYPAG